MSSGEAHNTPVNYGTLVRRAKKGDQRAWIDLTPKVVELAERVAGRKGIYGADADVVASDTLEKVFRKLPSYRGRRKHSFYAWVRAIAVRCCLDWIEDNAEDRDNTAGLDQIAAQLQGGGGDGPPYDPPDRGPSPEDEAVRRETWREFERDYIECLTGLRGRQREVWILRHELGHLNREIAMMLKITEATVSVNLHRAQRNIERCLAEKGWQLTAEGPLRR